MIVSPLQARQPIDIPVERQQALQRLAEDPQVQRANDEWMRASNVAIQRHVTALAARGDARSLLAASLISVGFGADGGASGTPRRPPEATRAWFDAARRVRPRDTLVAWMEASDCSGLSDDCNPANALAFLLQAEPDNAAVQLLALADAERRGDGLAADRHWRAAADAGAYLPPTLAISQLLYASLQGVDYPPLDPALARAMGVWWGLQRPANAQDYANVGLIGMTAAFALPAFRPITLRCRTALREGSTGVRREQCRRVLEQLVADQSILLSPMIGLPLLVQLDGDSDAGKARREHLRQFYWIYENATMRMSGKTGGALPAEYGAWFMGEGELPAMRRLIAQQGVPTQPPADWLPTDPGSRALVTTGRPLENTP